MRKSNNVISGYVRIARDISAEVRHKREREGLLKIGQELLCLADKQGYLKITTPSFLRISGYHPQDLVGHRLTDFIHPDDRATMTQLWGQLMSGVCVQRFESRWRTHAGCYRIISWDISPPESDGLVFASGWDVTDEKAHQRELERFLEFEKKIIGIVSHDLRNPIAATSLAAQAISRQKDASERIRAHAQRIYQSRERATRMIHDLLDSTQSRLDGGPHIEKHALDLAPAIRLILDELRLSQPQQRIVLECPEHLMLEGDADRLAQALSNVVGNSLKYGSPANPVAVSAHQSDGSLALAVHNRGNPIPLDIIPTLFLPLRRDSSSKPNGDHSIGLGLYIASEIVRAHDGSIDVQSSAEDGTTFTLYLPVRHAESSKRKTS